MNGERRAVASIFRDRFSLEAEADMQGEMPD